MAYVSELDARSEKSRCLPLVWQRRYFGSQNIAEKQKLEEFEWEAIRTHMDPRVVKAMYTVCPLEEGDLIWGRIQTEISSGDLRLTLVDKTRRYHLQ